MGLTIVMVMTLLGVALFEMSAIEAGLAKSDVSDMQAFYCAEAEVARVWAQYLPGSDPSGTKGSQPLSTTTLSLANGVYVASTSATVNDGTQAVVVTATCVLPNGRTRTVQRNGNRQFVPTEYAAVSGGFNPVTGAQEYLGDFDLGGNCPYGAPPLPCAAEPAGGALAGGADIIYGDIYVSGNVYLRGESTVVGYGSGTPPAITVPPGKTVTSTSSRFDPTAPGATGQGVLDASMVLSNAQGTGALDQIEAAAKGRMTAAFKGTTVYNLTAIFEQLGATSEGNVERNLARPLGCTFGIASADAKCRIWQDLVILGPKQVVNSGPKPSYYFMGLPRSPSVAPQGTPFPAIYAAAVDASGELRQLGFTRNYASLGSRLDTLLGPDPNGEGQVSRLVDFTVGTDPLTGRSILRGEPPIFYVDGYWRGEGASDLAYNGRATIVASESVVISDNMMYLGDLKNVNLALPHESVCPSGTNDTASCGLADMIGLVAKNDIWIGDANGTVHSVSALLLAGRDIHLSDFTFTGPCCKGPINPVTFNGAVMAGRQAALVRDWADPSSGGETTVCRAQSPCRPVVFLPSDTSCGVTGCWRFLTMDGSTHTLVIDTTKEGFRDGCVTTKVSPLTPPTCPPSTRRVTHFQLVVNYDARLKTRPELTPPGLPTGGTTYTGLAGVWKDCGISSACP